MNHFFKASIALGCMMVLSAGAARIMTPTTHLSDSRGAVKLEDVIPEQFGDWREEKNLSSAVINPQTEALLNRIYAQTLSRTYVNSSGEHVMLSIAYGTDQKKGYEVHYPEICYPAQGFQVLSNRQAQISTHLGAIPVNRLETNLSNQRYEPVTYWATTGDQLSRGGMDRRMKEIAYGFEGKIPDGLVFRVSTVDRDTPHAFVVQDSFVNSLVDNLSPKYRKWLMGLN